MTEPQSSWAFVGISPEARQAAELAAEAAGMELDTWLAQLIKYKSTMELKGREAVPLDAAILQAAAPDNGAAAKTAPAAPTSEPERAAEPETDAEPAPWAEPEPAVEPVPETDDATLPVAALPTADNDSETPAATAAAETPVVAAAAETPVVAAAEAEAVEMETPKAEAAEAEAPVVAAAPEAAAAETEAAEAETPEAAAAETEAAEAVEAKAEAAEAETPVVAAAPEAAVAEPETPATETPETETPETETPETGTRETGTPAAAAPIAEAESPVVAAAPEAAVAEPETPATGTPETGTPAAAETPAEPEQPAETSPRKNMPTEALKPSRLSALNQASEETIQGAFDAWRDGRTLEPLLVRPSPDERNVFEVIVGVERWHAARRAHIRELPVIVHDASDEEAIRLAMSARLKRGPLSPLTEANIYLSLMSEASMSTEQVARMVGKPPAHVATMVRVLNLPRAVREMLERGELTALHARALLDAPNAEALAREVIAKRLDIYQTEQLVRTANLRAERAEKVDLDAVDLELGEDEAGAVQQTVALEAVALDGDVGFGPETRFDRENFPSAIAAVTDSTAAPAEEAPPFDEADADLVFDDVPDDALDLIETPETKEVDVTIAAPATPPPATADKPAGPSAPKAEREPEAEAPLLPTAKKGVVTTELLEHHLSHLLGLKVSISEANNMGVISIHYTSREELSDVVSRLNSGSPG